jgi:hypothetical protein
MEQVTLALRTLAGVAALLANAAALIFLPAFIMYMNGTRSPGSLSGRKLSPARQARPAGKAAPWTCRTRGFLMMSWLASAWSFLTGLLPGGESLDTRCTIDPDGGGPCGPGF